MVRLLPKDRPVILVINKTDAVKDKAGLLPFLPKWRLISTTLPWFR